MQRIRRLLVLGLLLGLGCNSREGIVEPRGRVGKITVSIPPAPAQITRVVATLSRQGFANLELSLDVADSTQGASGSFSEVPVGTWHLEVEALDSSNAVRFRGASDVDVLGGQTSKVDLELLPTSGSINIRVRWGGVNLLVNGSFEQGVDPGPLFQTLPAGSTNIAGWVVTSVNIDYKSGYWLAADGNRSLDLDGTAPGGITQSFATFPGSRYSVRFAMAGNPDPSPSIKTMRVLAAGQSADFIFDTTGKTVQNMGWVTHTWSFTADSTTTSLEFLSMDSDPNGGRGPALDNVIVGPAAPGLPLFFSDDFDGTALDASKWILLTGNGAVTVANGKATLSCPAGGIFPYMVPRSDAIPAQGDFVVRVGMRYVAVASAGTGFKGTHADVDPSSETAFAYWQDTCCGGHRAVVGTTYITLSQAVDTTSHLYEWRSIQGTYSFYFDGQLMGSGQSQARPTSFFFGHPPVASLPAWSSQELDYVRVERL